MINNIKIFITGSFGYIGQCLIKKILDTTNYSLVLLQSKNSKKIFFGKRIKYYYYDNLDFDIYNCFKKTKPDVVIHLAGHFIAEHKKEDVIPLMESNFIFGVKLLDAMRETGIECIINTGTFWDDFKQDHIYHPVNLYASLKKCFLDVIQFYVEVYNFKAVTLKLYDVYGPGDERKKIIPLLMSTILNGGKLDVSLGEQYIDFVYIDDVVKAYLSALKFILKVNKSVNIIVDVASGKPIKLKGLVLKIERLFSKKMNINFGGRAYRLREIMKTHANIEYTKNVLDWSPSMNIDNGIKKIMEELK